MKAPAGATERSRGPSDAGAKAPGYRFHPIPGRLLIPATPAYRHRPHPAMSFPGIVACGMGIRACPLARDMPCAICPGVPFRSTPGYVRNTPPGLKMGAFPTGGTPYPPVPEISGREILPEKRGSRWWIKVFRREGCVDQAGGGVGGNMEKGIASPSPYPQSRNGSPG